MADLKLIGAVGVKVRPDTAGFRGDTRRGVERELSGYDPNVQVKAHVDADTTKARKEIEALERRARDSKIRMDIDFDATASDRLSRNLKDVRTDFQAMRDVYNKVRTTTDGSIAQWSKTLGGINKNLKAFKATAQQIKGIDAAIKLEVDESGFRKAQQVIDAFSADAQKASRISDNLAGDIEKNLRRITTLETQRAEHYRKDLLRGTGIWRQDQKQMTERIDRIKEQTGGLREQDNAAGRLATQWARLSREQRAATQEVLQNQNNLHWAQQDEDFRKFKANLQEMGALDIKRLKDSEISEQKLAAVKDEINRRFAEKRMKDSFDLDMLQRADNARIEREHRRHLRNVEDTTTSFTERSREARRKQLADAFGGDVDLDKLRDTYLQKLLGKPLGDYQFATMKVGVDEETLKDAKNKAEKLKHEIDGMKAKMEVEPQGLALMAARLQYATRPRVVNFFVRVNEKSLIVAEGLLKSLAGLNVAMDTGRMIEKLFTKFDTLSIKSGGLAVALGNVTNVLGYMGTTALSVGGGMAKVIGLTALMPAALSTLASIAVINSAAFEDFGKALDGDAKALAKLPPNAKAAVKSLDGLWEKIQQPIQNRFWEGMGSGLSEIAEHVLPVVGKGLADAALHAGRFGNGVATSLKKIALNGQLETMFKNLSGFFDNAAGAAEPLVDAMNTLGLRGSEYLPQFGTWLTKITEQFDAWIQKSDEAGDINRWIENGVTSLKDMWRAGGGVISMFQGLTRAANLGGGQGLTGFADSMERIGNMMKKEPFQSRMATIFNGARTGASELNMGVKDLGETLGKSSAWLREILIISGQLGSGILSGLARTLGNMKFQAGVLESFQGMKDLVHDLQPGFRDLGTVIGNLGMISAEAFRGLSPIINSVVRTLADITETLSGNISKLVPLLTDQVAGTLNSIGSIVGVIADAINGVLGAFNAWPEGIQKVAVALGAFLLLKGQLGAFMATIGNSKPFQKMADNWRLQQVMAGKTADSINRYGTRHIVFDTMRQRMAGVTSGFREIGTAARSYRDPTMNVSRMQAMSAATLAARDAMGRTAMSGLRGGANGLMTLMGGGWGLALAAGATAAAIFGQAQADARKRVDDLKTSLNQQTGAITEMSKIQISKNWMELDTSDLDNAMRGIRGLMSGVNEGSKAAHESAEALGLSLKGITDVIANGDGDKWSAAFKTLAEEGRYGKKSTEEVSAAMKTLGIDMTSAEIKAHAGDFGTLSAKVGGAADEVRKAQEETRKFAQATGTTETEAKKLSAAFDVMNNSASTAAERVSAIKVQLDLLKGGSLSADEAARNFAKAWDSAMTSLAGTKDSAGQSLDFLVDAKGKVTDLHGAGGELYDSAKSVTDAMLMQSQSAYESTLAATGNSQLAQEAALAGLQLTDGQLAQFAANTGIEVGKAKLFLDGFFGEDWQMKAVFSADNKLFFEAKAAATASGAAFTQEYYAAFLGAKDDKFKAVLEATKGKGAVFGQQVYEAYLAANPDPAKRSVDGARAYAEAWKRDPYTAILSALPTQAINAIGDLGRRANNWSDDQYRAELTALDKTWPGTLAAVNTIRGQTGQSYEATIKAFNGVGPGVNAARGDLNSVWDKSVTITTVRRTYWQDIMQTIRNGLNGGIHDGSAGGGNKFALANGMPKTRAIKAYADGGFENHTAMITGSGSPMRVWSEPETGGEAYIPMAASKRRRSLAILAEVNARFGNPLGADHYEDGGLSAGGGGGGHTFNIQNHYPIAEDTSATVNRALQLAGGID